MTALDALLTAVNAVLRDYYVMHDPYNDAVSEAVLNHYLLLDLNRAYGEFRAQQIALKNGAKRP